MALNDLKIRNLKTSAKPFKASDSHGLYLLVNPNGSRNWYLKYRIKGKESRLSLGAYPLITLAEARQQSETIRKQLAQNINPMQQQGLVRKPRRPAAFQHEQPSLSDNWQHARDGVKNAAFHRSA